MSEIAYTHEGWTDGLCFVIWKNGYRIARCDSKETAESICKTTNCHDELVTACETAEITLRDIASRHTSHSFHNNRVHSDAYTAIDLCKAALAKVRGEK